MTFSTRINDLISEASRSEEYASLAGENGEAYDALEFALRRGLENLQAMRSHAHEWSEEGFCAICGADGNA